MSTTFEIEQSLVADEELFSSFFDVEAGKKWFVKKIVAHLSTSPDVEGASRVYLAKAKMLVNTRRDPPQAREYAGVSSVLHLVVQAMYGSMGVHPAVFLDQDNVALLNFVTERRVRTIVQMRDSVNSDMFDFPDVDVWNSSLRPSARQFWQGNQAPASPLWPFVLSLQGKADRKVAITSLFAPPKNTNDQHRVECQTAATMVLMDSLLVAADPSALLASLDGELDGYLAIDNPDGAMRRFPVGGPFNGPLLDRFRLLADSAATGTNVLKIVPPSPFIEGPLFINLLANDDGGVQTVTATQVLPPADLVETIRTVAVPLSPSKVELVQPLGSTFSRGTRIVGSEVPLSHFLSDARPEAALFEQRFISLDDLQPGDVIHITGHPLLRAKIPTSAFGGERCVVVDPWQSFEQIRVTGHGVGETTLVQLASSMLRVANRLLTISRRVLNNCLNPALTLNTVASGTAPTQDNTPKGKALELGVKEIIARALSLTDNEPWTAAGFFEGTWEVYDFPAIEVQNLPAWDRQGGFRRYPAHWALAATGTVRPPGKTLQFAESQFFVFDYRPNAKTSITWPPADFHTSFIGLVWGLGRNLGATDERWQFGIPYLDDHAALVRATPLFTVARTNVRPGPTILTFDDMLPQLFYLAKDDNTEAWAIRPRVSSEAAYLSYLRTIGAIPNTP